MLSPRKWQHEPRSPEAGFRRLVPKLAEVRLGAANGDEMDTERWNRAHLGPLAPEAGPSVRVTRTRSRDYLARRLHQWRTTEGVSNRELATRLDLTTERCRALQSGAAAWTSTEFAAVAQLLRIACDQLLDEVIERKEDRSGSQLESIVTPPTSTSDPAQESVDPAETAGRKQRRRERRSGRRKVTKSKPASGREYPTDPHHFQEFFDAEEEDPLLPEGKTIFSWEKYSRHNDRNEGWGRENSSHRRRRRRYEGD
jgi:hypothetical protein